MDNTAWLNAAGSVPLLTRDEVISLARQIQAWQHGPLDEEVGREALNRMVVHNLRLVVKVWRLSFPFVQSNDPRISDMLQEGAMGLRHAALKFDPKRGYTFSTYAITWVRKYMGMYLRDKARTIRLSADCYAVINTINAMNAEKLATCGRYATIEEIQDKTKKSPETIRFFIQAYNTCNTRQSLDETLGGDGLCTKAEVVKARPDYDLEFDARAEKLRRIVEILFEAAGLTEDEQQLVRERCLYSTEPRSFPNIAADIGMIPANCRPHFHRVMRRLEKAAAATGMSVTGILSRV